MNNGLTLIELIVAIAIVGVIFLLTAPIITYAYQSYNTANIQFKLQQEAFMAMTKIINMVRPGGGRDIAGSGFALWSTDKGADWYEHREDEVSTPPIFGDFDAAGSPNNYYPIRQLRWVSAANELRYQGVPFARNVTNATFTVQAPQNHRNDLIIDITCSETTPAGVTESASVHSRVIMRCRRAGE